jgi:hypothetical protein
VLSVVEESAEEARLVLGEVRGEDEICSPAELLIDAQIASEGEVRVALYLENEPEPSHTVTLTGTGERTLYRVACLPRRCKAFHTELFGKGDFCVFTVSMVERG